MSTALEISPEVSRSKAQYSDSFKVQALLTVQANDGNVQKAARALNIPWQTLSDWVNNRSGISPEILEIRDRVKGPMADEFEKSARLFLERAMDPDAIAKTSAYYAQIAASDAIKSAQLLRGQPTSIAGSVMSDDERKLRLAELICKAQGRQESPEIPVSSPAQIEE